jgi:hypothetical protein
MPFAAPAGVLLAIAISFVFVFAYRRGVLLAVAAAVFLFACIASGLAYWAAATDYRDADGLGDCWPNCSAIQDATRWGVSVAPVLGLVAGITILVALVIRRRSTLRKRA